MLYNPATRTLTLARKNCHGCYGSGTTATKISCPTCKGTGRGPRGGRGKCLNCFGSGHSWDHENRAICQRCDGINPDKHEAEDWTDRVPAEALNALAVEYVTQDRAGTFNEGFLGLGSLWSCTDYGRAWDALTGPNGPRNVVPFLAKVVKELLDGGTQACKLLPKDYDRKSQTQTLPAGVIVQVHRNGYVVIVDPREYSETAKLAALLTGRK